MGFPRTGGDGSKDNYESVMFVLLRIPYAMGLRLRKTYSMTTWRRNDLNANRSGSDSRTNQKGPRRDSREGLCGPMGPWRTAGPGDLSEQSAPQNVLATGIGTLERSEHLIPNLRNFHYVAILILKG